jgi:hypothetical protein
MLVVPLVFGLVPKQAIHRQSRDTLIKPVIREHLKAIGHGADDERLVSVIKEIGDQFFLSAAPNAIRRKMSVADVRAKYPRQYRSMRANQNHRCRICGVSLRDNEEQLDHRIPYRLVGDVPDGSNWQLLCTTCNTGKWSWMSGLQPPIAQNWIYGNTDLEDGSDTMRRECFVSATGRYAVLVQRRRCESPGCKNSPADSHLRLSRRHVSGLPVADNLVVNCELHWPGGSDTHQDVRTIVQ